MIYSIKLPFGKVIAYLEELGLTATDRGGRRSTFRDARNSSRCWWIRSQACLIRRAPLRLLDVRTRHPDTLDAVRDLFQLKAQTILKPAKPSNRTHLVRPVSMLCSAFSSSESPRIATFGDVTAGVRVLFFRPSSECAAILG